MLRDADVNGGAIFPRYDSAERRKAADKLTRMDLLSSGSPFDSAGRHVTGRGRTWLAEHPEDVQP